MTKSSIFVGDGSLLIGCATAFIEAGGSVRGVVTGDDQIAKWATERAIPTLGTPAAPDLGDLRADYLFSVVNLVVLPQELLSRANEAAINFHDGPLPSYAGLNTPSWALIEGQTSHAVSWHEMTQKVDAGRVLKTRSFDITPVDTAFSLNVKAYELGLETFRELVPELIAGTFGGDVPAGERGWYGRAKRPATLGIIDFTRPAGEIRRLVRGLDFGSYPNPLTLPKLWTGDELILVGQVEVAGESGSEAGTVLQSEGGQVTIAAADRAITLSGLRHLDGRTLSAEQLFAKGDTLPRTDEVAADLLGAVGKAESQWEAALTSGQPAFPPYPPSQSLDPDVNCELLPQLEANLLLAAYLAWVSGLTACRTLTLGLRGTSDHVAISALRPVSVEVKPEETVSEFSSRVAEALAQARGSGPMASDLPLRIADPELREKALRALRLVVAEAGSDSEILADADLVLVLDTPRLVARATVFDAAVLRALAADFSAFAQGFAGQPEETVSGLPLARETVLGNTGELYRADLRVDQLIREQAGVDPEAPALEAGQARMSRGELDAAAQGLAVALAGRGAKRGVVVGVCLERGADLVIAMLAILKTGAAYLPLDPDYPRERIVMMVEDANAPLIVATPATAGTFGFDASRVVSPDSRADGAVENEGTSNDLAYLIYTSGSTGRPKGVMVPHRAVMNFFAGMDGVIPLSTDSRLLAVTSVSFDISVLEIFWTLARGATVVLQCDDKTTAPRPDFSLFYFASAADCRGQHAYRLLLEGAKFADENGFEAIWTPERHFHAFGGLYPNPGVTTAALATLTTKVKLRAGSVVAPLHHPVRIAEDWALIDNLSNGRAGIAMASGWQPNDFILQPQNFANRKSVMTDTVETVRKLWRGEKMSFAGHDGNPVEVQVLPRPVQETVPLWLTAAGNPETFAEAARLGCGVLTHLLGQTVEDVAAKIRAYRAAWRDAGHPGSGHVVLMLHTFVGESEELVRETARGPMKGYLKSAVDLVKRASWTFPTIVQRAEAAGMSPAEMFEKEELSAEDLDQLLEHAFERYYRTSGLFGTPSGATDIVRSVAEIGVDEIACLVDFGINTDVALANLPNIKAVMDALDRQGGVSRKASVAEEIVEKRITHLQCTPSMASYLAADMQGAAALRQLEVLMVGGEAFPPDLARSLRQGMTGQLFNMYGPTETTIWSLVARLDEVGDTVPLGQPIANTLLSVRSAEGKALPALVEGELWIGGDGVTCGYWNRPDVTADRFLNLPEGQFYRTGDQVRRTTGGTLEFLGRIDDQVKIRGHRIELGEIESALAAQPGVSQAVVKALEFGEGDTRLIGFVAGESSRLDAASLRAALEERLPAIMVPTQIVIVERMPLTPNGKIDRKALTPPTASVSSGPIIEAGNDTEAQIAEIWREALGVGEVSVEDNFFDLGGHSLLVVQVQRRLKERLQVPVSITDVFRFPTIRSLAQHLSGANSGQETAASRGAARAAQRRLRARG